MTDTNYHFGLDADLAAKREALYDSNLEKDSIAYIESTLGEPLPAGKSFAEALKSGVILCKFANKIKPGSCKSSPSAAPFVQMENIGNYLAFCRGLGMATTDLFMTVDLFEAKNLNQVIQNIQAVKRLVSGGGKPSAVPARPQVPISTGPTPGFCGSCGTKATAGAKFCGSCGGNL
ncbi:hypothetical protein SAMD00019534_066750, partial [Acytostelium subglobosum LB1]|uniref:hypothetical protein n=1 Tax=Acytostelium subglobosum LB1 TaxID=1410327 RepID=UPI0006452296